MTHPQKDLFSKFRYLVLAAVLAVGLITVLGSGGGDGGSDSGGDGGGGAVDLDTIGGTIYNSAQSVGDLLQVAFNETTLEYGYNVIEGIAAGESGTGTLSLMAGYTQYVYEDEYGTPVLIFPDNVFIAIPGGTDEGLMVGVPSLADDYNISDIQGVYNFVELGGSGAFEDYEGTYGTFRVNNDGTWDYLEEDNLPASGGTPDDSGTWVDQGNGIIYGYRGADKIVNVMIHPSYAGSATEKVLIIDINDQDNNYRGIMLGVKQQEIKSGDGDGTYTMLESNKDSLYEIDVSGGTVTVPGSATINLNYDYPWTGFVSGDDGTLVLVLPGGIIFGGGEDAGDSWVFAGIEE